MNRRTVCQTACALVVAIAGSITFGSDVPISQRPPQARPPVLPAPTGVFSGRWCDYPAHARNKLNAARAAKVLTATELEPNDDPSQAQFIPASGILGAETDFDVNGSISPGADKDFYRVHLAKGDIIGLAVVATSDEAVTPLDPMVGMFDLGGNAIVENDDDIFVSSAYPVGSPWPGGVLFTDSAMTWIAPVEADYLVRVSSFANSRSGPYTLSIVIRRPKLQFEDRPTKQIIFLDFDGAENINAVKLFGGGWYSASIPSIRPYLFGWGLTLDDEDEVVQAIIDVVEENFDDLRTAALNGNLPFDGLDGSFDVEVRNSRDHPDPFGQPNVSRVIIGGGVFDLGIDTIGIAEAIDPGNYGTEDTAVVLLDYLSDPAGLFPPFILSINDFPLASGFTIVDAIGRVVGNIVSHEIGHYLGLWHTDNTNTVPSIIDQGGFLENIAGSGSDGILGSADDWDVGFIPDEYIANEAVAFGIEPNDFMTAFALSTGKVVGSPPVVVPDPDVLASIRATPTYGTAPLTVAFAGGGIDAGGNGLVSFSWNFGDGRTASGPTTTHTYSTPGDYTARLTVVDGNGSTAQAATRIVVVSGSNRFPTAEIVATPNTGQAPLLVVFEGSATDSDGIVIRYDWNFGDGGTAIGQVVEHVFLDPGTYGVSLTVTDDDGGTGTVVVPVVVGTSPTSFVPDSGSNVPDDSDDGSTLLFSPNCGTGAAQALAASLGGMLMLTGARRRRR